MLGRDYENQNCSVARALELIGERWTLLIVRDAFLGLRRFEQFQESLGIARNVLADRLDAAGRGGHPRRVRYSEHPERFEYRLTQKGRDLNIALTALRQWGDEYLTKKPPVALRTARMRSRWSPRSSARAPTCWARATSSSSSFRLAR